MATAPSGTFRQNGFNLSRRDSDMSMKMAIPQEDVQFGAFGAGNETKKKIY